MWFIAPLFVCEVIYSLIGKWIGNAFIVFACFIYVAAAGFSAEAGPMILFGRTALFVAFYVLGKLYREHLEYRLNRYSAGRLLGISYFVYLVLSFISRNNYWCVISWLQFKGSPLISELMMCVGIFQLMQIGRFLSEHFEHINRVADVIAENSMPIMCHHLFMLFLIQAPLAVISSATSFLNGFEVNQFLLNVFYCWYPFGVVESSLLYCAAVIFLSIKFQKGINVLIRTARKTFEKYCR